MEETVSGSKMSRLMSTDRSSRSGTPNVNMVPAGFICTTQDVGNASQQPYHITNNHKPYTIRHRTQ